MTVWYKQGVLGDLKNKSQKALGRIAYLYEEYGEDLFITSIREGNHGRGSLHYIGDAFDIQKKSISVPISIIKKAIGPDFDIVDEGNHIHVEYDPKD